MITDAHHADQLRHALHRAADQLIDAWKTEQQEANAPRSGPTVAVSGGSRSDPTQAIATDPNRERDLNRLGGRITGHLQAMQRDVAHEKPRHVDDIDRCWVCRLWPGVRRDGRCTYCGTFYAIHGQDRTLEAAEAHHRRLTETRVCEADGCDVELQATSGEATCGRCRQRKHRTGGRS